MIESRPLAVLTCSTLAMFLLLADFAYGQSAENAGATPLFSSHSVLEVRIEAPMTSLMRDRPDEDYLDGKFTYTGDGGIEQTVDLKLRTRGKFRRQRNTCPFAPIMLNFRKQQVEGTEFDGQDKLKLVTHCNSRNDRYEQLVLREFLTYRLNNVLTDKSFGARLMRVTYVDTEGDDTITRYGFVIEDEDDIGNRLNLEKIDTTSLKYSELDTAHVSLVTMFEYLIGNTDYSLVRGPNPDDCCHNAIPFSDGETIYSIPYDFDHAGLIDAPYAKPNPQFKTRSVRTRVYRGLCQHNEVLPGTLGYLIDKKADMYALVNELTDLDDRNRKQVTDYLDDFFDIISNPKQTERQLIKKCS